MVHNCYITDARIFYKCEIIVNDKTVDAKNKNNVLLILSNWLQLHMKIYKVPLLHYLNWDLLNKPGSDR